MTKFVSPFKSVFYPDYQKKLVDAATFDLFEAKRKYLEAQQAEQYATSQKEYQALRVRTLSDTLERLKGSQHETLVDCNANRINAVSTNGVIVPNGQGAALSSN